jgi:hypothetical protein
MNVAWPSAKWIFLAQVFSTLAMVGVIWFVQLVHYPLFNRVGTEAFLGFQACNLRKTGWVVIPFLPGTHRKLVMTNWIRTIAWSARGWLILWMLTG